MRIYIVRHGETIENKNGIIQGHLDGQLSKTGIEQAKSTAECLKKEPIDYIYSSDLKRAADTASYIAVHHPNAVITLTEELRERYWGDFQGKNKNQIVGNKKWSINEPFNTKNAETIENMYIRAKMFLQQSI